MSRARTAGQAAAALVAGGVCLAVVLAGATVALRGVIDLWSGSPLGPQTPMDNIRNHHDAYVKAVEASPFTSNRRHLPVDSQFSAIRVREHIGEHRIVTVQSFWGQEQNTFNFVAPADMDACFRDEFVEHDYDTVLASSTRVPCPKYS